MRDEPTVWILSELYAPELTSTGYYLTSIAERTAASLPHRVRVVASQPTYSARGTVAPRRESLNGVDVYRTSTPGHLKDSLRGRVANMLAFCAQSATVLVREVRRGDVVVAVTNPPVLPYLAAAIARLRGARFVLLVHDMFPETLEIAGIIPARSPVLRPLHALAGWLVRSATHVIAIGRDMERRLRAKGARRISVLANWADIDDICVCPYPGSMFDGQPMTVQYAGNIGRTHDITVLLDAAERLGPLVRWDFIGTGARRAELEETVRRRGLEQVRIHDFRPRAERSASLGACHLAIISFVKGMSGISVPSRMYNVMAAGRPIVAVCDDDSEVALVIRELRIGWVVRPGDPDALARTLTEARGAGAERAEMGLRARRAAETVYSRDVMLDRYAGVLSAIAASR